jgi:hypothetical protein
MNEKGRKIMHEQFDKIWKDESKRGSRKKGSHCNNFLNQKCYLITRFLINVCKLLLYWINIPNP